MNDLSITWSIRAPQPKKWPEIYPKLTLYMKYVTYEDNNIDKFTIKKGLVCRFLWTKAVCFLFYVTLPYDRVQNRLRQCYFCFYFRQSCPCDFDTVPAVLVVALLRVAGLWSSLEHLLSLTVVTRVMIFQSKNFPALLVGSFHRFALSKFQLLVQIRWQKIVTIFTIFIVVIFIVIVAFVIAVAVVVTAIGLAHQE